MGLTLFLIAYVLGGVTLIPGVLYLMFVCLPPVASSAASEEVPSGIRAGEIEENATLGVDAYKEGWIMVTTEYLELPDEMGPVAPIQELETKLAYLLLYKLAVHQPADDGSTIPHPPTAKGGTVAADKHRYYGVLKHGNLFLYKDELCSDVRHVIVLSHHFVTLWPPQMLELALFTKYSAIAIVPTEFVPMLEANHTQPPPKGAAFYVYCDLNIDKEDWWFNLIKSTKVLARGTSFDPSVHAKTLHFNTKHMVDLIQTLYSSEGQLQTKWLNALIGRVFLGLQRTNTIHDWLYAKLAKKLNKIKKPGFLDEFKITHIYPGNLAPFFTYPQLKEISPDGTVMCSTYLSYTGLMLVEIATKMLLALAGMRLNKRDVDVTLKVTLNKFSGPMLIKIKPPPLERIWYSYEIEPQMELKIEPVVSSRQLSYNFVTNLIHKKFEEAIRDLLVLPHWDDMTFYDTSGETYRGGIWERARPEEITKSTTAPASLGIPTEGDAALTKSRSRSRSSSIGTMATAKTEESVVSDLARSTAVLEDRPTLSSRVSRATNKAQQMGKKLRNSKSFTMDGLITVGANGSPVDEEKSERSEKAEKAANTLKKIGKWYFKDEKPPPTPTDYTPPEMISNRRGRKSSTTDLDKPPPISLTKKPLYDFGNVNDNSLVYSNESGAEDLMHTPPFVPVADDTIVPDSPLEQQFHPSRPRRKPPPDQLEPSPPA